MAQDDYNVANASGAVVRADINSQLNAVATNNSGGAAPTVTFAHMWWFDTTNGLLKQRDAANAAWVTVAAKDGSGWRPYWNGALLDAHFFVNNVSATSRLLGRVTAGAGDVEELTGTQATTLLDAFTSSLKGLAPASGGGTANFLRADGSWAAPSSGAFSSAFTSAEQTITGGGSLTIAHGLGAKPTLIQAHLVCKTAELGYSINDELIIDNHGINLASNQGQSIVPDATNLNVRFGSGTPTYRIIRKDTGVASDITNANWRLVVRAWV